MLRGRARQREAFQSLEQRERKTNGVTFPRKLEARGPRCKQRESHLHKNKIEVRGYVVGRARVLGLTLEGFLRGVSLERMGERETETEKMNDFPAWGHQGWHM